MVVLAAIGALLVAALALARYRSPRAEDAAVAARSEGPEQSVNAGPAAQLPPMPAPATAPAARSPVDVRQTVNQTLKTAPVAKAAKDLIGDSAAPKQAAMPATDVSSRKDSATEASEHELIATAPASASNATTAAEQSVTITGCLEIGVGDDRFRLTDTEGADAPKSRSWRSAFLKKRTAPVALVEAPGSLALEKHVGHRVAATGLLISRELRVRSLRVVGPSCS